MRRSMSLAVVVALALAAVLVAGWSASGAQQATPEPIVEPTVAGDLGVEVTSFGVVEAFPPVPATVDLFRLEYQPGASVTFPPGDPALGLIMIESGTLTLRGFSADVTVTRAGVREIVAAGTETQLGPGDGFHWEPDVGGEVRNDGTEPVITVGVDIRPAPPGAATPTP